MKIDTPVSLLHGFKRPLVVHSTAEALEEGRLVEASDVAEEVGIPHRVLLTQNVWESVVSPQTPTKDVVAEIEDRLFEVLWSYRKESLRRRADGLTFLVLVGRSREIARVKAIPGTDAEGEEVLVMALPDEESFE